MTTIRLYTSKLDDKCPGHKVANYPDGFVAEFQIEEIHGRPAALYWGQRFFIFVGGVNGSLIYREDIVLVIDG